MRTNCFEAYQWDPVAEARAVAKTEFELGVPSATSLATRVAAAKLQANEAEQSGFIGNPEWKLDAKRCMVIILDAEAQMQNHLHNCLGAERSQDLLNAFCEQGSKRLEKDP